MDDRGGAPDFPCRQQQCWSRCARDAGDPSTLATLATMVAAVVVGVVAVERSETLQF